MVARPMFIDVSLLERMPLTVTTSPGFSVSGLQPWRNSEFGAAPSTR